MRSCSGGLGWHVLTTGGRRRNGLAPVGVGALGRVEPVGAMSHGGELIAGPLKLVDVPIEIAEMAFQQLGNVVARAHSLVAHVHDGGDLGESQPRRLGVADEAQPIDGVVSVVAVAVRGADGPGKDPNVLVVADRLGRNANPLGELSYLHGLNYTT